jgi:hypothetical protein
MMYFIHQHVSAVIAAIFSAMLVLQQYKTYKFVYVSLSLHNNKKLL